MVGCTLLWLEDGQVSLKSIAQNRALSAGHRAVSQRRVGKAALVKRGRTHAKVTYRRTGRCEPEAVGDGRGVVRRRYLVNRSWVRGLGGTRVGFCPKRGTPSQCDSNHEGKEEEIEREGGGTCGRRRYPQS